MPDSDLIDLVRHAATPRLEKQPWLGWLLVALCRQRVRQTWLLKVHEQHLADVDDFQGDVPGLAGWTFDYHGSGLCLTGPDGEAIDVDFDDGENATMDPYFVAGRLRSLRTPQLPEAQIQRCLPASKLIVLALDELHAIDALHHPRSSHVFLLSAPLDLHHEAIAAIDFDRQPVRDRWLAALGDVNDDTNQRLSQSWLIDHIQSDRGNASLLRHTDGLLPPEQVQALAAGFLNGPVDGAAARAFDALRKLGIPPDETAVAFLGRLDPAQHHPYWAHAATAYLLDHNTERARCLETIEAFAAVEVVSGYRGNPYRDHLALLMLHRAPDRAWPLLRRAAHEFTPAVYSTIGAVLALLDDDRAPRMLLEAALDGDDTRKRYLLACLASRDDVSQALAVSHMPPSPDGSEGAGYTFEEVQFNDLRPTVERNLAKARKLLSTIQPS